jgi:hypothetical protein
MDRRDARLETALHASRRLCRGTTRCTARFCRPILMYLGGALSATINSKLYACEPLRLVSYNYHVAQNPALLTTKMNRWVIYYVLSTPAIHCIASCLDIIEKKRRIIFLRLRLYVKPGLVVESLLSQLSNGHLRRKISNTSTKNGC